MDIIFDDTSTKDQLKLIEEAFLTIASNDEICAEYPTIQSVSQDYLKKRSKGYSDETEIAFLNLYCEIHRTGSSYSDQERDQLDQKHGYFNHPGGISPLLKANTHISETSVVADLGAGNGLQGLLFQYLYPHHRTLQVELSLEMIQIGMKFQRALGIPEEKIEWVNDDILNFDTDPVDFLYLYRPSKPLKEGLKLYDYLQKKLNGRSKPLKIFSIADCLKDFLSTEYKEFYNDGHLTCFSYPH